MVDITKVADQADHVNALFYGDGGTGKTTALASMANLGRVLYVDAEAGVKRRPLEDLGVKTDNIELLRLGEGLDFQHLEDAFWSMKRELDDDPQSWVGVCWDSGTEIYHALLDAIVGKRVAKAEKLLKGGKPISEAMADRFFVDRDNYGVMSEQIRFLLRRFRDLPCHFGIAFLERRDQDERTREVRIGPSITPALQSDVIGWHDIVCRTNYDAKDDLYLGAFRPEGVRQGKDRYGVLPKMMVDPTFDRIVAYVTGEVTESSDPRQTALEGPGQEEQEQDEGGSPKPARKTAAKGTALAGARARAKSTKGE